MLFCIKHPCICIYPPPHDQYYKGEAQYKSVILKPNNHFEILGGLGVANLRADDGELGVTSNETDKLVQTNSNDWNTFAAQLGAGYVYYFGDAQTYSDDTQWFPSIEPELNLYYLSSNSIDGDVWRFNSSAFNNATFDIPIHSLRLMLDAALTIVSKKKFSLYAIAGIGNAWNRASYSDKAKNNSDCSNQQISLNSNTHSNFSWEAGVGATYAFNDRFALSLEYLYTDLGTVKTSSHGSSGTIASPALSAPSFNLRSQTALLNLHVAI